MTVAGDVGSGTGSEPMIRYGEKPQRRGKPYKKMKSFRDFAEEEKVIESPVGKVGRTTGAEAMAHIENNNLAKRFRKIIKELGGVAVAKQLLSGMSPNGNKVSVDESKTVLPNKFLRDLGFKLKEEKFEKDSFSIEFYNNKDCKEAYMELMEEGYNNIYYISFNKKIINIEYL